MKDNTVEIFFKSEDITRDLRIGFTELNLRNKLLL